MFLDLINLVYSRLRQVTALTCTSLVNSAKGESPFNDEKGDTFGDSKGDSCVRNSLKKARHVTNRASYLVTQKVTLLASLFTVQNPVQNPAVGLIDFALVKLDVNVGHGVGAVPKRMGYRLFGNIKAGSYGRPRVTSPIGRQLWK